MAAKSRVGRRLPAVVLVVSAVLAAGGLALAERACRDPQSDADREVFLIEKLAREWVYAIDSPPKRRHDEHSQQAIRQWLDSWLSYFQDPFLLLRASMQGDLLELEAYLEKQAQNRQGFDSDGDFAGTHFERMPLIDGAFDRQSGFSANVLRDANGQVYIVFRGTELTGSTWTEAYKDLVADGGGVDPALADRWGAIGQKQYAAVVAVMDLWAQKYPQAIVAGQSLGAALMQIYVAHHPSAVKEAYGFNAPAVSQQIVDVFTRNGGRQGSPPVRYTVVEGDFVSIFGGEVYVPGEFVEASGGSVAKDKNQGDSYVIQHRGYIYGPQSDTVCRDLSPEEYASSRHGHKPFSEEKFIDFIAGVYDTLTPQQQQKLRDWLQAIEDGARGGGVGWHDVVRKKLSQATRNAYSDDQLADLMDRVQAELDRRDATPASPGAGGLASRRPSRVELHRPPGWGVRN